MTIKDHLGEIYPSKRALATAYGMNVTTLNRRLQTMCLEEALTMPVRSYTAKVDGNTGKEFIDSGGVKYKSRSSFISKNKITKYTFYKKILSGKLTANELPKKKWYTPTKGYDTVTEMCRANNIIRSTYENRIRKGYSQEEALAPKIMKYTDHLGNKFSTEAEMCAFHGISFATYRGRVNRFGKSDMERLLAPARKNSRWQK